MNYIKELNAFEEWLEVNFLPPTAQLLWYKLMALNNKCGWVEWFSTTNPALMAKIGVSSEKTLIDIRNKLKLSGRIDFKPGKKGQPTKYKIIPFDKEKAVKNTVNPTVETTAFSTVNPTVETTDIYKLETETKKEIATTTDMVTHAPNFVDLLCQEFGRLTSPTEIHKLQAYVTDDGMDPLVVCEAIKRARLKGNTNVAYVEGILKRWRDAGVLDLAGISRADLEFEKSKHKGVKQTGTTKSKAREPDENSSKQTKSKYPVLRNIDGKEFFG